MLVALYLRHYTEFISGDDDKSTDARATLLGLHNNKVDSLGVWCVGGSIAAASSCSSAMAIVVESSVVRKQDNNE